MLTALQRSVGAQLSRPESEAKKAEEVAVSSTKRSVRGLEACASVQRMRAGQEASEGNGQQTLDQQSSQAMRKAKWVGRRVN